MSEWNPIQDLPENWRYLQHEELHALATVWQEQKKQLQNSMSYQRFLDQLRREIAIETGVIEGQYNISRGITQLLIEQGIDIALIPHGATDKPPSQIVAQIRDHEKALDYIFDIVGDESDRRLSNSFIKQLHQLLTRNQHFVEARDRDGNIGQVPLRKGEWKLLPNNPFRGEEIAHTYCPPEQVQSQMECLLQLHMQHLLNGVSPEVEAAWLHHRFTQIHPFQDGNGRVARMLASLVFIRANWFPLSITRDDTHYIDALEQADAGNLQPLTDLFASRQKRAFIKSLSLSEQVLSEQTSVQNALDIIISELREGRSIEIQERRNQAEAYANALLHLVHERLEKLAGEIKTALRSVVDKPDVYTDKAEADNNRASYYRFQIVETAKVLEYYANLRGYKSWARLTIKLDNSSQTTLLFSFHVLGYEHEGVMVCSASAFNRSSTEDGDTSTVQDIEPLSTQPFEFTYLEKEAKLTERFNKWMESALVVGLSYWRKGM